MGLPSTPGTQTHDLGGGGSDPPSPNICLDSAANLKSGNLTSSQDVAVLAFSYNSTAPDDDGPLGKKWTHSYNLQLSPLNDDATLTLRTEEGNIVYFRLSDSIYYPEAISGDSSWIVRHPNGTYTRTLKNGIAHAFDPAGKLTSITDQNGNATILAYSGSDLAGVTDPNGRTTTLTMTSSRLTAVTDHAGRTHTLAYTNDRLASLTDPLGNTWHYTYDDSGRMLTKRDPANRTVTYAYDPSGRLLTATDPEGRVRTMGYTQKGTTTVTEKDGGLWTYRYDPTFAVKTERTDPLGNTTRYAYDMQRNLTAVTAPDGGFTRYSYDGNGNLTGLTDPLGNTTAYTYNAQNRITSRTDPRGTVTTYGYDGMGNLISVSDLAGTTVFQYDPKGNVTAITDAANRTVTLTYDGQNNLTGIADPLGNTTTFTYDAMGNRLSMTDPLNQRTEFAYNGLDQLIQVTDPRGNITRFTHDHQGNVLSTTDAKNRPTAYGYNYRGQLTGITDALNNLTQLSYGPAACGSGCGGAEKLAAHTDALDNLTGYHYDMAGRLVRQIDPLGRETLFAYDPRGNLLTRTNPDGRTITYTYDAADRLTHKRFSDGSLTEFRYDANGNLVHAGNAAIAYDFTYDAANRLTAVTDSHARTLQYQYNAAGNRTAAITPDNRTIAYGYDAAGRLATLASGDRTFTFAHDATGRRTGLALPNGTQATYSYDGTGNLIRIRYTGANAVILADVGYTYDEVDNRLTRSDTMSPDDDPPGLDTLSYGRANELLNLNAATYSYDANGNRIQKSETGGSTIYQYDEENRLVRVDIPGNPARIITYAYDPVGRRIEKNMNGTIRRYLYDREDILLEYDGAGAIVARYLHGPGIDEPLALERDGQMYYYQADGLGSIIALMDSAGGIAQTYRYDTFGNLAGGTPAITQPYTFTAREYDPETGLYYYRARHYDPIPGRFLQRDPIGFAGGDPNLYAYVGNNPLNWLDPWGLYGWEVHYYLTKKWALEVGIDPVTATAIAMANQSVDELLFHRPENPFNYHPIGGFFYHFPSGSGVIEMDLMTHTRLGMVEHFGRSLHSLQDSFSHGGIGPWRHFVEGDKIDTYCESNPRDQAMKDMTKWWLKQFKTSLDMRHSRPFR